MPFNTERVKCCRHGIRKKLEGDELYFGDFMDGRYAWELNTVQVLLKPVPAKGQLSLWNWDDGSK